MTQRNSRTFVIATAAASLLFAGMTLTTQAGDFQDILDTPSAGAKKPGLATVYKPLAKKQNLDRGLVDIAPSASELSESGAYVGKAAAQPPRPRQRVITRDAACSENPFVGLIGTIFGICDD